MRSASSSASTRSSANEIPYAFHNEFGFLTACPTNVGTGLRASVLIHLPGLVLTKEIAKVLAGLQQVGLTYRGLYGEGSEVVGNFFQISNQTTLGRSEGELLDYLVRVVNARNRARRRSKESIASRRGLYYRRQALACVRHAALCTQLDVRRSDELSEQRATGCRFETDKRSECIYPQQAPDFQSVSAPWRMPREGQLTESEANIARAQIRARHAR